MAESTIDITPEQLAEREQAARRAADKPAPRRVRSWQAEATDYGRQVTLTLCGQPFDFTKEQAAELGSKLRAVALGEIGGCAVNDGAVIPGCSPDTVLESDRVGTIQVDAFTPDPAHAANGRQLTVMEAIAAAEAEIVDIVGPPMMRGVGPTDAYSGIDNPPPFKPLQWTPGERAALEALTRPVAPIHTLRQQAKEQLSGIAEDHTQAGIGAMLAGKPVDGTLHGTETHLSPKANKGDDALYLMPDGFLAPAKLVSVYNYGNSADLCVFTRLGPLPLTSQTRVAGTDVTPGHWFLRGERAYMNLPSETRE